MGHVLIFLDETYPAQGSAELVAVGAVACFTSRWHRYAAELRALAGLRSARKLQAIREFVGSRRLRAVIAGSRLDLVGATQGRRDVFPDLGSLSRRDSVWAQTMGSASAIMIRRLLENRWRVQTFDLYYDPKSLSPQHREQIHSSLQRVLSERTSQIAGRQLTVRAIHEVPKPSPGQGSDITWGTWLAHWIARLPYKYAGSTLPANIEVFEVTRYSFRYSMPDPGVMGATPANPPIERATDAVIHRQKR